MSEIAHLLTRHNSIAELILVTVMHEATISLEDDLQIRSGFYYLTNEKFQCESKVQTYYELGISRKKLEPEQSMEEAEKMVENQNHCDSMTSTPMYEIDGYSFRTCVCNYIHPELNFFLTCYHEFETHGTLPMPGSLGEQSNYLMDVLTLIKSMKLEKDQEDRQKAERQNRSKR